MNTVAPTTGPQTRLPGARLALGLLLAINLFNYIDRQVLSAVLPKIDFGRSKAEMGLLASMFLITYTFAAPVFGWLGDRTSRWMLIGVGVIAWSLASGGTGLAATFGVMLLTRAIIGIGEGAYGPVAPTLIADMYPVEQRGAKLAWFYSAIPVGSALGYVLGGLMAEHFGWRSAFYAVVPPGILLGVLCFFMREPKRGAADGIALQDQQSGFVAGAEALRSPGHEPVHNGDAIAHAEPAADSPTPRRATWANYRTLSRTRSFVLCTLGMTAMTFTLGGVAVWIPTFYYEREAIYRVTPECYQKLREHSEPPHDAIMDRIEPVLRWFSIDAAVKKLPDEVIAKLKPLEGKDIKSMDAFRAELRSVLSPAEMKAYRGRIGDAARDNARSLSEGKIGLVFGGIVVLSGLGATLLGGWLGDRLRPRYPSSYFLVSGVGALIAFPFFLLAVEAPLPWGWVCTFVAVFFLFFNTGPTNTILANVVHPAVRSTAFAINILILHLFGDVASPPIVGWVDDVASLREGMFLLSGSIVLAGIFWLWGMRYLERDTERAPKRI